MTIDSIVKYDGIIVFCAFDSPSYTGGPNSWLRRLLPSLKDLGFNPKVYLFYASNTPDECSLYQALQAQGISQRVFPWKRTTQQKTRWIIVQLAQDNPSIFVPNLLVCAFFAARWAKKAGIPTIGVLHSDDEFYRGVTHEFVCGRKDYRLSELVCVSNFLKERINLPKSHNINVNLIPYGVPIPTNFALSPKNVLRLIYVGRLAEEQKQISLVTSALCRVVNEIPNTEAVLYGDGPAKYKVESILSTEGKGLPISLGGKIDNSKIQDVMSEAHILVLLSDYEGLPIALMEAMACGLVPICMNIRSGIPELVEHKKTGLLVNDRGDSFLKAVKYLSQNYENWSTISNAARHKIITSYSTEVCTEKWAHLLSSLMDKGNNYSTIEQPVFLDLPPVHSPLAREDKRLPLCFKKIETFQYLIRSKLKSILTH